jgi:hypothetical protein
LNSPRCGYRVVIAIFAFLLIAPLSLAQTLSGTVTNGTTGKPASGDDVVLLSLAQGMEEAGRTKTDASGKFSFKLDNADGPHLIRAIHQGVTYHAMAPPGTPSVQVQVYDVSKKLSELSVTADVMRFQADANQIQGVRLFAVDNTSNPPRTQLNDQNFEFYLPDGAQIDTGLAKTANGQPVNSAPVPQKEKNRYAFIFPLRPGETQFQVVYHLPYTGQLSVDPRPIYPTQHFVVMMPKTMKFDGESSKGFQPMQDPQQSDAVVEVASNTQVGQPLAFKVSGTGTLQSEGGGQSADGQGGPAGAAPQSAGRDTRPGGGLGPPIDAPDPLEKYRWWILGGFALALIGGAVYIATRSRTAESVPDFAPSDVELPTPARPAIAVPAAPARSGMLLEALKEELFQLEMEHKQGHISQQEYEKAKEALDATLSRALKRESAKV